MVQGFICAYVIGNLCIWEGTINAEMYTEVLEQHNIDVSDKNEAAFLLQKSSYNKPLQKR